MMSDLILLARDRSGFLSRQVKSNAAPRGVDRVKHAAPIDANDPIGAGQKSHQVRRQRRLDTDDVRSQSAQPRSRVRDRIDPSKVCDSYSCERLLSCGISRCSASIRDKPGSFAEGFLVVLAEPRRAALDSPRGAGELAGRAGHPHLSGGRVILLDEKSPRLVLLVARDFRRRKNREARKMFRLGLFESLSSRKCR